MGKTRVQDYIERFSGQSVRFNPYATKKLGLLQSQTLLKLEDYMLICAPYQLSMKQAVVLVILSRQETAFFQQFQSKLTSLSLTFQKTAAKNPMNLFIRGTLDRIGPVKGKNNVCMAEIQYKNCPNDLIEILGDYLVTYQALKTQFDNFRDRTVAIDEATAQTMRYNNYAEAFMGKAKTQVQLQGLAVNRLKLLFPKPLPDLEEENKLACKLYFQIYQFTVNGVITKVETTSSGAARVELVIDFSPELVEILDDFFFRQSFKKS